MPITGWELSWGDGPSRSCEADWFQRKGCWPLWDLVHVAWHHLISWGFTSMLWCSGSSVAKSGWALEWLDLCPAGPQGHGYLYLDFKGQGLPAVIDLGPQPWKSGWRSPGRETPWGQGHPKM